MERDEERWKKFKEEQRKRLWDIEEQVLCINIYKFLTLTNVVACHFWSMTWISFNVLKSVPKMTDLEILAGKRRIKLQAGLYLSIFI